MSTATPTMLDVALDALHHGFAVVPPTEDGAKRPSGQWKTYQQRLPTEDEVRAWYAQGLTGIGIVCGAVSGNLEMLEFEGRAMEENIGEQFADLAARAGLTDLVNRINAGYCETTPTGGLHLLYRVTGPVAGNTKLARRPATPAELEQKPDDPIRVLIETRGEGGYVVVAPSHGRVHPTGNEWALLNGGFDTVATITPDERDELHRIARALDDVPAAPTQRADRTPTAPLRLVGDDERPGDAYNHDPAAPERTLQLLERRGWVEVFRRPHDGHQDVHLRRPGKQIGTSAVLHMDAGTLVNFSSSVADFDQETGYTPFAVLTILDHAGDYQAAARALLPPREPGAAPFPIDNDALATPAITNGHAAAQAAAGGPIHLPDTFWNARPALDHIRQAARSKLMAPDAVLGAVLTRIAAITPHPVEIPGIVGAPKGLTTFAALVGPPEAGKSAATDIAAELIPAPPHVLDRVPMGSGEGMVEILFDLVTEEDPRTGKKIKVKRQIKHAAIINIDEGQVLTELGSRQGSTLLPTLRTAFTHGTLGAANASTERKRIVDGRSYVYGITLGIQPEKADGLLSDKAGGTPQRFIWLHATDPGAHAGVPWPGPLQWEPPDVGNLEAYAIIRGGYKRYQLDLDPAIADELIADRIAVQRGEPRAAGSEHQMLVRLKAAALLTLLDHRLDIGTDDWDLAGTILATSHTVRRSVEATISALAASVEQAVADRHARRELHVETTRESKALASASRSIGNVVHRHHEAGKHTMPAGCTKRCLHGAMAGKHKAVITVDDAIAEAERLEWITPDGDTWTPSRARPA